MLFSSLSEDNKQIKIIDFGMATVFSLKQKYKGKVGTPLFLAPEVISGWYNHKCDVWSLGVTAFWILTGKHPFNSKSYDTLYEKIKTGQIDNNKNWSSLSENAQQFILSCLT